MQEEGLLFLLHGEVTDHEIDIFDREKVFIDRTLIPVTQQFIVLEDGYSKNNPSGGRYT